MEGNEVWGDVESSSPYTSTNTEQPPNLSHETSESVFDSHKDLVESKTLEESFSQLLTPSNYIGHYSFHPAHEKSQISVDEGVWDPLSDIPSDIPSPINPAITQDSLFTEKQVEEPVIPVQHIPQRSIALDTQALVTAPSAPWIEENQPQLIQDPLGALVDPNAPLFDSKDSHILLEEPKSIPIAQYQYEIQVTEPQKIGDALSAHVVYKIKTLTNAPEYKNTEFCVNRRFRDFLWLYNQLVTRYPGVIVHPMPEKHALGRFQDEFVENRRASLEKFIQKVASHHLLQLDADLRMFLESETFNADRKSSEKSLLKGFILTDSAPSVSAQTSFLKIADGDATLGRNKNHIETLEKQLKALHKALESVVKQRIASANYGLGESMINLANLETEGSLMNNLRVLGSIHKRIREVYENQAKQDIHILISTIDEHIRLIGSTKMAFNARAKALQHVQTTESNLIKKKEAYEKVKNTFKVRTDKLNILSTELNESAEAHEYAKKEFERITHVLYDELARVDAEKVQEFTLSIKEFLKVFISSQQEAVLLWESYFSQKALD